MGSQVYQYLYHLFIRYFTSIIKKHCDKSSQLDHKNNYEGEYSKKVGLKMTLPRVVEARLNKQTHST